MSQGMLMALLFLLALLLYGNTLGHEYALDDAIVIYDNEFTEKGLGGIVDLWSHDSFRGFFKEEGKEQLVAGGRYRPLSLTLFAVEYALFGDNPALFHLMNVMWYGVLLISIYLWLRSLGFGAGRTESRRRDGVMGWVSSQEMAVLAVVLLFAAHPVHVEVVANIKGRDEILCLLLCVMSAHFFTKKPWLSGLLLFFAFTAKEMALTALLWIPLAYLSVAGMALAGVLRRAVPLLAGTLAYLALRWSVLGFGMGAEPSGELMNNPFLYWDGSAMVPFSLSQKLATVSTVLSEYMRLLVFPVRLNHDYYPAALPVGSWADPRAWFGLLTAGSLLWLALRGVRKRDIYGWAAAGFLAGFALIGNLFFPIGTFMGERFLFMPSLFFVIATAAFIGSVAPGRAGLIFALIFAFYAGRTVLRNPVWENDERLFLFDVKNQPESAKLRNAAAGALLAKVGKRAEDPREQEWAREAVRHLEKALSIHPLYKNAWLLLGNAHFYLEDFVKSEEAYRRALKIDPGYKNAADNLAVCYREWGRIAGEKQGNIDLAIQQLEKALQLRQDDPETFRLLGVAYGMRGETARALEYFERLLDLNPANADGWYNMGVALMQAGRTEEGKAALQRAAELDPVSYKKQ